MLGCNLPGSGRLSLLFLGWLSLLKVLQSTAAIPNLAQGRWLDEAAEQKGARCLDGSSQFYAFRPSTGTINQSKFYIHIQGGAWCTSSDDCYKRSLTRLGSSNRTFGMNETVDLAQVEGCNNSRWCGVLSVPDPKLNPLAYDWNFVFIYYCDGGSFTGNNDTVEDYNGHSLFYRGFRNLNAVFDDLIATRGIAQADTVIVGGDSAGGLATWIHIDHIAQRLSGVPTVRGLPDSGFFLDYGTWRDGIAWVYAHANSTAGLNQACVKAKQAAGGPVSDCIFAEHTAVYCATPMFAMQGRFDSYQTGAILHSSDASKVNPYGRLLTQRLQASLALTPGGKHAAFVDSCHHHCGYWQGCLGQPIDGVYGEQAFEAWLEDSLQQRLWLQNETYPCSSCCADGPCELN